MNRTRRISLAMLAGAGLVTASLPMASVAAPPDDLKAQVAQQLGIPAAQLADGERTSAVGLTHVAFQQQVDGVPVVGAQGVATLGPDDELLSVSGRVETTTKVMGARGRSAMSAAAAKGKAVGHAKKAEDVPASTVSTGSGKNVLIDTGLLRGAPTGKLTPAIQFDVRSEAGAYGPITVDKFSGEVVHSAFGTKNVNRVICDIGNTNFTSNCSGSAVARAEGDPVSSITDVNDVYDKFGTATTWFDTALGVNITDLIGLDTGDGNGKALRATTRACHVTVAGCPMKNAGWTGQQMIFGEGVISEDVITHEMGHGVSDANGIVGGDGTEGGSIHEHMSDVFGEVYDQDTPGDFDGAEYDWQIGEDVVDVFGHLIRDMANPGSLGDPERYSEYSRGEESHAGAGVGNKTAYLVAAGGTFNGQTVNGIGTDKMLTLFYAVNSAMTAYPTYADEGSLLKSQCEALTSAGTLTAADCAEVQKATTATEISSASTGGKGKGGGKPRASVS